METETQVTNSAPAAEPAAKSTGIQQKKAVLQYALEALGGAAPAEGQTLKNLITKEVRKSIRLKLFEGMKSGAIKLSRPMDDSKLKKYSSSLINNWLKKDTSFN